MDRRLEAVLAELGRAVGSVDPAEADRLCEALAGERRIVVAGCGRERLQLNGFAMRLFHMGLDVSIAGDVFAHRVGPGDLVLVTSGPGELPTMRTIMQLAKAAGATVFVITAQAGSTAAREAEDLLVIPAQTMADDQDGTARSVLPMGSVFEGALFVLFELMVMKLRERLDIGFDAMRARHANLE